MKDHQDLLQERLEQLEAGAPLEACLADLAPDLADLVQLVAALDQVEYPARDGQAVAAQRAGLLHLATQEHTMKTQPAQKTTYTPTLTLRNWLRPLAALAGAAALLFVCALIAMVGVGIVKRASRDAEVAQVPAPTSTSQTGVARSPLAPPASELSHTVFVPLIAAPGHPQRATLQDIKGLVQVQASDGAWTTVRTSHTVTARQRVRTGELSSARLVFFDGSQARLGPNTELSLTELDARVSDGPRIVALTQWAGQTEHDVAQSKHWNSRYEVRTPSATGKARGTSFQVRVTADLLTLFSVDEGSVAVTNLNVTVVVLAGQLTSVQPDERPSPPAFRITGEGEVTEIGPAWTIAGQTFETHAHTITVGNPQVGDWVYVEGHLGPNGARVADCITLLRRAPVDRFSVTGRVQEIGDAEWTVAGQAISVDDETAIDDAIDVGDLVRAEGVIQPDGTFLAQTIRMMEDTPGHPFDFVGVAQEIGDQVWTISGVAIAVDAETEIEAGLEAGDVVRGTGWVLDDDTWLAKSIERAEEEGAKFAFTGTVESIDPWIVSGIPFETRDWTEVEPGIELGDRVQVQGHILENGTWVAAEIERLDEDDDDDDDDDKPRWIVFKGTVESIDPWVVNGVSLLVNDKTKIDDDIAVGDLVKVKARVLFNQLWLAKRIRRIETDFGLGCYNVSVTVVGIQSGQIVLRGWPNVDLDGASVEGELKLNSIITISICVGQDGTPTIVNVIVIYQPPPVIAPPPPQPQPPPPPRPPRHGDDDDDDDDDDD